ncbi:MAG: hypothetical protein DYH12_01630 [Sorangiineae bacterium PRO1]|nr:hypothetical protein [Sorangiineae bacterium PRO1]
MAKRSAWVRWPSRAIRGRSTAPFRGAGRTENLPAQTRSSWRGVRFALVCSCVALFALACGPAADGESTAIDEIGEPVLGGTVTTQRPEISSYASGFSTCTGTLISPQYMITAANCAYGYPMPGPSAAFGPAGTALSNVWIFGTDLISPPPNAPAPPDFNNDLALVRLAAAPGGMTPAWLASSYPSAGQQTSVVGHGCVTQGGGSPGRTYRDFLFQNGVNYSCSSADLGGPLLSGYFSNNGSIQGVASGYSPKYANTVQFREDIAAVMRTWDNGLELGVNRWGHDLPGMPTASANPQNCQAQCNGNNNCRSFTWTTANQCWMKGAVSTWIPCATCTSGVRSNRAASGLQTYETGINRSGGDFYWWSTTHSECRAQCLRDGRCKAYTYYSGTCYLKSHVGPPSTLAGATSGVRMIAALDSQRNGTLLSGPIELQYPVIEDCGARCKLAAGCKSFTYRRPEVGVRAQCWLYSNAPIAAGSWGYATGDLTTDEYGYY